MNIIKLQDKSDNAVYAVSHSDAVKVRGGGTLSKELGVKLFDISHTVVSEVTNDVIATTQVNIPAGTTLLLKKTTDIVSPQTPSIVNLYLNGSLKTIFTVYEKEYICAEDVTSLRVAIPANRAYNEGEQINVTIKQKGLRSDLDALDSEFDAVKADINESVGLKVISGTNTVSDNSNYTTDIISASAPIETIPSGTTLIFEKTGTSTTKYSLNGGSGIPFNDGKEITLSQDVTSIRVAVPKNEGINGDVVSVIIRRKGEIAKNIDEIENDVETIDNYIFNQHIFTFNDLPSEGSYNNSKTFFNGNVNIPAGTKLRIEVSGIGTAITNWVYIINDNAAVSKSVSTFELEVETPITFLRVYTLNTYIESDANPITVTGDILSVIERIDDDIADYYEFKNALGGFVDSDLFNKSGDIANRTDFPTPFVRNPIYNNSKLNLPIGNKVRIEITEGFGTVVNKWYYSINGNKGNGVMQASIELESTEQLPINGLKVYLNNNNGEIPNPDVSATVSINGEIIGKVSELDSRISALEVANAKLLDFNTNYVLSNFASDPDMGAFESGTYTIVVENGEHVNKNVIISSFAKYVKAVATDAVPTIQFQYKDSNNDNIFTSTKYTIGKEDKYAEKEWRIPRFFVGASLTVTIVVPTNITLYINEISNRYSDEVTRQSLGYRMNAHMNLYNFNSMRGITESAKLGFPCCIVVPKKTSDGVWVCFHDDDNINGLRYVANPSQRVCWKQSGIYNRYDVNGVNIGTGAMPISSIDYATLQTYCYPANWDGTNDKVPTVEEFFAVCAKTGMHPMFSCHGVSPISQFSEIKALAKKYGLLPYLNIKTAFNGSDHKATMNAFYTIFGNEIESYTGDVSSSSDFDTILNAFNQTDAAENKANVRVGLELFATIADTSKVTSVLNAGYFAAIADNHSTAADAITSEEMDYWISQGVMEFTEYRMFSYGLNW